MEYSQQLTRFNSSIMIIIRVIWLLNRELASIESRIPLPARDSGKFPHFNLNSPNIISFAVGFAISHKASTRFV